MRIPAGPSAKTIAGTPRRSIGKVVPAAPGTSLRVWPMIAASRSVALVPAPTSRWTFSPMVIASIPSRIGSFPSCGSFSAVSRQAAALFCPGEGACCCPAASCCRVGSAARSVPVTAVVSASISAQCIHAFRLISNQKGKIVAGCRGAGVRAAFCRIAGLTGFPSSLFTIPVVAPDSVGHRFGERLAAGCRLSGRCDLPGFPAFSAACGVPFVISCDLCGLSNH